MTEADILLQLLPGVPAGGEFRQQLETRGSPFRAFLQDILVKCWDIPGVSTTEAIALALLSRPDRRATKSCILDIVRKFSCIAYPEPMPGSARYINVTILFEAINQYLGQETLQFEVSFPPDGYRRLRAQPRLSDTEASKKCWAEDIGAEMIEEERLEFEYPFDKWVGLVNWPEYFDAEYNRRREEGTGPQEHVFVLPPNQENVIFENRYIALDTSTCSTTSSTPSTAEVAACSEQPQKGAAISFDSLPKQVKIKILRYLLLLPGKVRVTATVKDLGNYECRPESYIDTIPATKYKFGLAVKAPRGLVPKGFTENIYERGYYWNFGNVTTLLAPAAANRELWILCREIFHGENHFEVLDDFLDDRLPDKIPGDSAAGEQLAHRWLELMSGCRNSEEGHTFGEPPLTIIRELPLTIIRELTIDLGGSSSIPVCT
ncbi:hypothetical protein FB567DRAFT_583849 [Paraphoma chrysanthemicola]|uniref:Uncharacterized protein n=1 Tax=Paraphoma chrysanthemicola TaxID=798071 RepID=A0A8K0QV01_9PLEO|nr:hypothetical protein FB567DRAFT_583849 [Paraphoma chrysanthemicola]